MADSQHVSRWVLSEGECQGVRKGRSGTDERQGVSLKEGPRARAKRRAGSVSAGCGILGASGASAHRAARRSTRELRLAVGSGVASTSPGGCGRGGRRCALGHGRPGRANARSSSRRGGVRSGRGRGAVEATQSARRRQERPRATDTNAGPWRRAAARRCDTRTARALEDRPG